MGSQCYELDALSPLTHTEYTIHSCSKRDTGFQCQWVIYKATVISVNSRKCLEYLTQHESSGRCSKTAGLRQRERLCRKALCCDWLTHVCTVFIPWEWTTVQRRQRAEKAKGSSSLLLQPVNIITPGTLFHIITAPALLQNNYQSPGRSNDTAEPQQETKSAIFTSAEAWGREPLRTALYYGGKEEMVHLIKSADVNRIFWRTLYKARRNSNSYTQKKKKKRIK